MDLIYTNSNRADLGVLSAYSLDLSFGASENDFEIQLGKNEPTLEDGAYIYIEGTEYGGNIGSVKTSTNGDTVTYKGRTWHGIINSKIIQPDTGAAYLVVSGDANDILSMLIERLGLGGLFEADTSPANINIKSYKFARYCAAYDGIRDMLADNGAKLRMVFKDRKIVVSAVPIGNYTDAPIDGDIATLTVEKQSRKINHLICLGKGELAERTVIHLYADISGEIVKTPFFTGIDEIAETYENTNAESADVLESDGRKKFKELRDADSADVSINETINLEYDIGDIIGATDNNSGVSVSAVVNQKIVKIQNGAIRIEYKAGG